MKVRNDFVLRKIADLYVVIPIGKAYLDLDGMLKLNESGAFLWNCMMEETTPTVLAEKLASEYGILPEDARNDVDEFIAMIERVNCIEH